MAFTLVWIFLQFTILPVLTTTYLIIDSVHDFLDKKSHTHLGMASCQIMK